MLLHYRAIGVEPLFIYDTRSCDATRRILEDMRAEVHECTPSADFAEAGMIEFGSKLSGVSWILRLDDDEFPTRRLLDWARLAISAPQYNAYRISRRDVAIRGAKYCYSRWPARWAYSHHFLPNAHARLHAVSYVKYVEKVHTSGVEPIGALGEAPQDCFFIHCNNILRSPSERLQKLRTYARYDPVSAWENADESLSELTNHALHDWSRDGLQEFEELFDALPAPRASAPPVLTEAESALIAHGLLNRLEEEYFMRETLLGLRAEWFQRIPRPLLKPFAKFLLSARSERLHEIGVRMWNYQSFLSSGYSQDRCRNIEQTDLGCTGDFLCQSTDFPG